MEFIYEIKNALPKEVCEELIQGFLKDDRRELGSVNGEVDLSKRKSTNLWLFFNDTFWGDISTKMIDVFVKGFSEYGEYLVNSECISYSSMSYFFEQELVFENPFINQTKEGEFYHWHLDDGSKNCNFQKRRLFTCLVYLNTLEEDQGGCTEFRCGKKIRPEQGKMLIFPSTWTYEHRGTEVKNGGVKYTCGTWVG